MQSIQNTKCHVARLLSSPQYLEQIWSTDTPCAISIFAPRANRCSIYTCLWSVFIPLWFVMEKCTINRRDNFILL